MKAMLRPRYGCAVELALDVLGGKWKVVILAHLKDAPLRYGDLRKRISKMSDKMLTQRLAELVALDLIERHESGTQVEYRLTPEGQRLRPVLTAMNAWGQTIAQSHAITFDYER